jgi:hypothetical protein
VVAIYYCMHQRPLAASCQPDKDAFILKADYDVERVAVYRAKLP